MIKRTLNFLLLSAILITFVNSLKWSGDVLRYAVPTDSTAGCLNFTPYVKGYNPDYGPHPPPEVIDALLDVVVSQTNYTCIQTYGVMDGLNYTFESAYRRGLKVMAVIWLNPDQDDFNERSIAMGIQMARKYSKTIISLSCGSELRVRNPKEVATPIIQNCIRKLKAANVAQPVTTNDYYWFWCELSNNPCGNWVEIMDMVDFIATNVFAWWDNRHSPQCVPAEVAARVNLYMYRNVVRAYPNHVVVISEFGWPAGPGPELYPPYGYAETNEFSNVECNGYANETNQDRVIFETLSYMKQFKIPGVTFSAFRETWKTTKEGAVGPYWGFCNNEAPYTCKQGLFPTASYPVRRPPRANFGDVTPIYPIFPGDDETAPPRPAAVILDPIPDEELPRPDPIPTPKPMPIPTPKIPQQTVKPQPQRTVVIPRKSNVTPIPKNSVGVKVSVGCLLEISILSYIILLLLW